MGATLKQKQAIKNVTENHGNIYKAMIDAGYSHNTAKKPTNLTKSKSWAQLLEQYLPDDKLLRVQDEGLEANKVISAVNTGKEASGGTTDFIEVPDYAVRHKYLETGLKLKKRLSDKTDFSTKILFALPTELIKKNDIPQEPKLSSK